MQTLCVQIVDPTASQNVYTVGLTQLWNYKKLNCQRTDDTKHFPQDNRSFGVNYMIIVADNQFCILHNAQLFQPDTVGTAQFIVFKPISMYSFYSVHVLLFLRQAVVLIFSEMILGYISTHLLTLTSFSP
jgi:hypothetical protein